MPGSDAELELAAAKALCSSICAELDVKVAAIEAEARARAVVAHHVISNPDDPLGTALAGGRMVDHEHLTAVASTAKAVAAGDDPVKAAGAEQQHVDALAAAAAAHEPHRERLAAAYAAFAARDEA